MSETTQTYQNHTRYHTPFHFVMLPLAVLNLLWASVAFFLSFDLATTKDLVVAFLLLVIGFLARSSALRVQDRVIRLEELLRYQRLLSPELAQRAAALKPGQIVALRFASDAELPDLLQQTLEGKFAKPKEIKEAVKNWRGDYLRV